MSVRGGALRMVVTTAVVTSLAWIGALAAWLQLRKPPTVLVPPVVTSTPAVDGGRSAPTERLLIPVAGIQPAQLVDTFTQARAGGARVHDAIDIMAPRGTPVIAAASGLVEKLFVSQEGGNTVYVRSPDGRLIYYYAHLETWAPGLAEGQQVAAGAPLGTVGTTGNASPEGPHLHFAITAADPAGPWHQSAAALNPYPWLVRGQRPESGALTQRSAPSEPSPSSLRRNERPESTNTEPRRGPEVNSTREPVIR